MVIKKDRVHQALNPLFEAAADSKYSVCVLPMDMAPCELPLWCTGRVKLILVKVMYIYSHIAFAFRSIPVFRNQELVIVREYLTVPLLLSWPFMFVFRRKLLFIVNHTIQFMHKSPVQRWAFWLLSKLGARYVFLESSAGSELALSNDVINDCLVLPQPAQSSDNQEKASGNCVSDDSMVVGIIGDFREEKGNWELLEYLFNVGRAGEVSWELMIGTNDSAVQSWCLERNIMVMDTSSSSEYARAFNKCDIVILNYEMDSYFYRCSGIICDAISMGTAVLCPDYPILRHQISAYGQIGEVFSELHEIPEKIRLMSSRSELYAVGFVTQISERSVLGIQNKIDRFFKERRLLNGAE